MMVGALHGQSEWTTGEVVSWASTHKGPGKRSSLKCLGMSRSHLEKHTGQCGLGLVTLQ